MKTDPDHDISYPLGNNEADHNREIAQFQKEITQLENAHDQRLRDLNECRAQLASANEAIAYWKNQWEAQTSRLDRLMDTKTPAPDDFSQLGRD